MLTYARIKNTAYILKGVTLFIMDTNCYLKQLDNAIIPKKAHNYMLSTYSIILEAWRRGLNINIRIVREASGKIEPYYTISDGNKKHHFSTTRGDFVSRESIDATKDKQTAKNYLLKNNVPTPIGKSFDENISDSEIVQYAEEIGYPVVIKPLKGTGGRGVIANIKEKEDLINSLKYVRDKLKSPHIILEKHFAGDDYRLYVIGDEVVGAIKRIKANVIGDGKSTINQLVKEKNKRRQKLPALSNRPIKLDNETDMLLKNNGYDRNSIPAKGEIVYLKSKNNVSSGGDSVDVTDQVSENIKQIAIEATKSFPSLPQAGVDLMVNEENDTAVVIELNSRAHITSHLFPMVGQARDIPSKIVDFYFPDSKEYNREDTQKLYIDFDFIYNSCLSRVARDITIPKIAQTPIVLKRHLVTNCSYSTKLANRVRRAAFNNHVSGYIKQLKNGDIAIVSGGNSKRVDKFIEQMKKRILKLEPNAKFIEKKRTSPIKHGFHIESPNITSTTDGPVDLNNPDIYIQKYANLKHDYQRLIRRLAQYEQKERVMEITKKQNFQLKKQITQLKSSTSWKVTKPIRKLGNFLKKK